MTKTLIQDLLTENRYWTFWSADWSTRINVYWEGKTKWSQVVSEVKKIMLSKHNGHLQDVHSMGYERQVQLREPDVTFE